MTDDYRTELVQVAASCLAAAQVADVDTTSLGTDNEGVRGRMSLERLLNEVRDERRRQELKWGSRDSRVAPPDFWLEVIGEEIGEVAEEIAKAGNTGDFIGTIMLLGKQARELLETR